MTAKSIPLGRILLERKIISEQVLARALAKQQQLESSGTPLALGEILIRARKIDREQLKSALADQRNRGVEVLRSRTEVEEIYGGLTVQHNNSVTGKPFVDSSSSSSVQVAETANGYPLILVTPEFHKQYANAVMTIRQSVIAAYKGDSRSDVAPKIVKVTEDVLDIYHTNASGVEADGNRTTAELQFEQLIKKAYESNAVDVHFFRTTTECKVKFRVNGSLRFHTEWVPDKADTIISVGFESFGRGSKYPSWSRNEEQRVRIKIQYDQHISLDCRYEHAVGDEGAYHACIRILSNDKRKVKELISLRGLGFTGAQADAMEAAASEPSGLFLLAGPTGSGKSTTLAAMVKYINRNDDVNVLTVESPIERELPAFQTSVSDDNDADGNEFANAIKSMLRRDPDVGMVGEIRDHMSASAAATGVQTGHVLLSTVHAQSGIEIIDRLTSPALGLPAQTVGSPSFVNALVFQMLLPRLDEQSKVRLSKDNLDEHFNPRERNRFLKLFPDFERHSIYVRGASEKFPEGIAGMTICAEVVVPDDRMRHYFRKLELTEALAYWRDRGAKEEAHEPLDNRITGLTAAEHAMAKVKDGLIDPRDLEAYFGHLDRLARKFSVQQQVSEAA